MVVAIRQTVSEVKPDRGCSRSSGVVFKTTEWRGIEAGKIPMDTTTKLIEMPNPNRASECLLDRRKMVSLVRSWTPPDCRDERERDWGDPRLRLHLEDNGGVYEDVAPVESSLESPFRVSTGKQILRAR